MSQLVRFNAFSGIKNVNDFTECISCLHDRLPRNISTACFEAACFKARGGGMSVSRSITSGYRLPVTSLRRAMQISDPHSIYFRSEQYISHPTGEDQTVRIQTNIFASCNACYSPGNTAKSRNTRNMNGTLMEYQSLPLGALWASSSAEFPSL